MPLLFHTGHAPTPTRNYSTLLCSTLHYQSTYTSLVRKEEGCHFSTTLPLHIATLYWGQSTCTLEVLSLATHMNAPLEERAGSHSIICSYQLAYDVTIQLLPSVTNLALNKTRVPRERPYDDHCSTVIHAQVKGPESESLAKSACVQRRYCRILERRMRPSSQVSCRSSYL